MCVRWVSPILLYRICSFHSMKNSFVDVILVFHSAGMQYDYFLKFKVRHILLTMCVPVCLYTHEIVLNCICLRWFVDFVSFIVVESALSMAVVISIDIFYSTAVENFHPPCVRSIHIHGNRLIYFFLPFLFCVFARVIARVLFSFPQNCQFFFISMNVVRVSFIAHFF